MNSKERVLKALNHEEPDRVPIGEWGIDHDTTEKVLGRKTYWRSRAKTTKALWAGRRDEVVESYKEDLVELIEKLDHDLVPVLLVPPKDFEPTRITRIDKGSWKDEKGRIWKYSSGNDEILCTNPGPAHSIESLEELREYFESEVVKNFGLRIKSKGSSSYEFELQDESQLELVRYVIDRLGEKRFIFARDLLEFEIPIFFFGGDYEDFFLFILRQPELAKEACDLNAQMSIALANIFVEEGVDAITAIGDFSDSTGPMVSPHSIRNIFFPGMKKLSDFAHRAGIKIITHNCGNNWKIMDVLIDAGYDCYQSIQSKTADMDLRRLKKEYGDRLAFWGGINIETLVAGTPEKNKKDVLYALRYAAPGGGFILGSSNSVCYGSRYDNYMAALETHHKYGSYPIQL